MTPARGKFSFALTNDLAEMSLVAEHLEAFCAGQGISADVVWQLNLALDEIVTHIIAHGYGGAAIDQHIRIDLAHDGTSLTARIEDDAATFDPRPGIQLVKTLVDEVTYSRQRDQNVLTIKKTV